ncbi:MAG: hypothetical protein R3A52_17325 [Polyangiales bacterium]
MRHFTPLPFVRGLSLALSVCAGATVGCGATSIQGPSPDASAGTDASIVTDTAASVDRVTPTVDVPTTTPVDVPSTTPVDVPVPPRDVGAPTDVSPTFPCGPENDGRACDSPGTGCGGAGGGECSTSFNCACGADRRWSCSVSSPPFPCDAGAPDVSIPDDVPPSTCSIVGRYAIPIMGETLWFEFTSGGVWRGAISESELSTTPAIQGTYTVTGSTVTLSGETRGGGMGMSSCTPMDVGRYALQFAPDCGRARLRVIADDCAERGMSIDMFEFQRR